MIDPQAPTLAFRLPYDFNEGRNEYGFREVVLDIGTEHNVHRGDIVLLSDGEVEVRGRVRCLVAIVEDIEAPHEVAP